MKKEIPRQLINSLNDFNHFNEADFLFANKNTPPITSVRLNPNKPGHDFLSAEKVAWCSSGIYLGQRPDFTSDPFFHAGCYYVQEASSMFVEHIFKQEVDLNRSIKVLDLCAAPGGKATHVSSLLNSTSLLLANEVIKTRVGVLIENITKAGVDNVIVTSNDPKDFRALENYFDVILIDAPCSGSGMFRKNPNAIDEWSEQNVNMCSQRQERILADAVSCLKPGGYLIYSTCSYSKLENEDVCDFISAQLHLVPAQIKTDKNWGIVETVSDAGCYGYRFYPHKTKGEGFFCALFKKPEQAIINKTRKPTQTKTISLTEKNIIENWICDNQNIFVKQGEEIVATKKQVADTLADVNGVLNIKKAGVVVGEIVNNDLLPSHDFAMSMLLSDKTLRVNVDKTTALKYLKRENILIHDFKKGWLLVCYEGVPLGWAKNLGNRINNYYPKNWRILKDVLAS